MGKERRGKVAQSASTKELQSDDIRLTSHPAQCVGRTSGRNHLGGTDDIYIYTPQNQTDIYAWHQSGMYEQNHLYTLSHTTQLYEDCRSLVCTPAADIHTRLTISMLFTFTETVWTVIGTGSPGLPPRLSHGSCQSPDMTDTVASDEIHTIGAS